MYNKNLDKMTQEQLRMQMLAGIITEGEYKQQLDEIGIGSMALGAMVGYFGYKSLKSIAQKVLNLINLNSEEMTKERSPEDLKIILNNIANQAGKAVGGEGTGFITELLLLRRLEDKIDSGEITTLGQLQVAFKDYLKSLTSGE
jgi:hypothetical protein